MLKTRLRASKYDVYPFQTLDVTKTYKAYKSVFVGTNFVKVSFW